MIDYPALDINCYSCIKFNELQENANRYGIAKVLCEGVNVAILNEMSNLKRLREKFLGFIVKEKTEEQVILRALRYDVLLIFEKFKNIKELLKKTSRGRILFLNVGEPDKIKLLKCEFKDRVFSATSPKHFLFKSKNRGSVIKGLREGVIDAITPDKVNGEGDWQSFIPFCYGLVIDKHLSKEQLKEKIHNNPLRIIS